MSFTELDFKPHAFIPNGVQARLELPNRHTVSVVGGKGLYGDGRETFEVAVIAPSGKFVPLSDGDDVLGWCSKDEVEEVIAKAKEL